MRSNDYVTQALAAIPLWRAFLDQKEAEQDALLAQVRDIGASEDTATNELLLLKDDEELWAPSKKISVVAHEKNLSDEDAPVTEEELDPGKAEPVVPNLEKSPMPPPVQASGLDDASEEKTQAPTNDEYQVDQFVT